jgi:hypothetical protein
MHKKKGSERDCFIFLISFNIARSGWEHKEQNLSSFNLGFLYHKMLQWYKISLFEPNKERIISLSFPSTRENNYFSDHFLPHPLVHSITPPTPPFNNNYELFTINAHVLTKTAYVLTLYGGFD